MVIARSYFRFEMKRATAGLGSAVRRDQRLSEAQSAVARGNL
jgi:hypothetical protein